MQILNSPEIPADALTVPDAARKSGVSKQAIWERIKRGSIDSYHIGSRTLVSLHDVNPKFSKPLTLLDLPNDAVAFADAAKLADVHPSTVARAARQHLRIWTVGSLRCVSVTDIQSHLQPQSPQKEASDAN